MVGKDVSDSEGVLAWGKPRIRGRRMHSRNRRVACNREESTRGECLRRVYSRGNGHLPWRIG